MADKKANVHAGHRARIRQEFIKSESLDSFDDHRVLEMLLFYAYPMKDTNEIAHKLLNEYGSLYNLFNRPPQDLMNKMNLTENVAALLSMMPHLFRRYLRSGVSINEVIDSSLKAKKLLSSYLVGLDYECFVTVHLDAKRRVLAVDKLTDKAVSEVSVNSRMLIENALLNRTKYIIMGHNHPAGTDKPSAADVSSFKKLYDDFKIIDVTILDNIIICNKGEFSFCESKQYNLTYNP